MNVLHVAPVAATKVSGISKSVPLLATAQAKLGASVTLLNSSTEAPRNLDEVQVLTWPIPDQTLDTFDLVVFHSTFILRHALLARTLRTRGIPYALTPRGGLTSGALAVKRLKKRIGRALVFDSFFRNAVGICFLSASEAENSEKFHLPWSVAGNGCEVPPLQPPAPARGSPIRILFVGRLDPHTKGLDLLIQAFARSANSLRAVNAQLNLIGPAIPRTRHFLSQLIQRNAVGDIITLQDPVPRSALSDLFRNAHLFVHTSRFEGMPNAVLEAMAHGLPVLITPGTNLGAEITSSGAGWLAPPTVEGISAALEHATISPDELLRRGFRARLLIEQNFTWEVVARRSLDVYQSFLAEAATKRHPR